MRLTIQAARRVCDSVQLCQLSEQLQAKACNGNVCLEVLGGIQCTTCPYIDRYLLWAFCDVEAAHCAFADRWVVRWLRVCVGCRLWRVRSAGGSNSQPSGQPARWHASFLSPHSKSQGARDPQRQGNYLVVTAYQYTSVASAACLAGLGRNAARHSAPTIAQR